MQEWEKNPESQARQYLPLQMTLKGANLWALEMALWSKPLPGLEIPSRARPLGIWIS